MSKTQPVAVPLPSRAVRRTLLTAIVVLAFAVRLVNITGAPAGIYPDEAQNAYDALRAMATGQYQWYYPDNNGREGLMMNLDALVFGIAGVGIVQFKIVGILIGTLTVAGMYLLAREVFHRWRIRDWLALTAAFLMATSSWHIHFSRMNFRAILLPLVLTFAFWLTLRAVRILREGGGRRALTGFLWAGLVFGVGFHTYIAFRIAPAILVVLLGATLLTHRLRGRDVAAALGTFVLGMLITAAPMVWTLAQHPEYLQSRSDVGVFAHVTGATDAVRTLGTTVGLSLGQFIIWNDQNWRHAYPPLPLLEPVTGILFVVGLLTAAIVSVRFFGTLLWDILWRRAVRSRDTTQLQIWPATHLFLLAWFVAMLAPAFLTTEGLPHALRSIGTMPAVYLLAVLGIGVVWRRVENTGNRHLVREFFVPMLAVLLLAIGTADTLKYHALWAQQPEAARAYNKNLTDIGLAAAALPATSEKVIIAGPLERLPIIMLTVGTPHVTILYPHQVADYVPEADDVTVFMTDRDDTLIAQLTAALGDLHVRRHTDRFGIDYYTAATH